MSKGIAIEIIISLILMFVGLAVIGFGLSVIVEGGIEQPYPYGTRVVVDHEFYGRCSGVIREPYRDFGKVRVSGIECQNGYSLPINEWKDIDSDQVKLKGVE